MPSKSIYRTVFVLLAALIAAGCATKFTVNGLICPTSDQATIQADLRSCEVYDLEKVDQAMSPDSCECLEKKGYIVDLNASR